MAVLMLAKKGSAATNSLNSSKSWRIGTVTEDKIASPGTRDKESVGEFVFLGLY